MPLRDEISDCLQTQLDPLKLFLVLYLDGNSKWMISFRSARIIQSSESHLDLPPQNQHLKTKSVIQISALRPMSQTSYSSIINLPCEKTDS